jgi:hypothetical protein
LRVAVAELRLARAKSGDARGAGIHVEVEGFGSH